MAVVNLVFDLFFAFGLNLGCPDWRSVLGLVRAGSRSCSSCSASGSGARTAYDRLHAPARRAAAALTAAAAGDRGGHRGGLDVGRPLINLVQVLAAVAAGVLAFVLGALIFQIEEADEVWRALAARFRR